MANLIPKEKYAVHRGSCSEGDKCFICMTVEFNNADGKLERMFRILSDRGVYPTLDAARAAAESVDVEHVYDNGVIVFTSAKT